jgi:hypothetical protein
MDTIDLEINNVIFVSDDMKKKKKRLCMIKKKSKCVFVRTLYRYNHNYINVQSGVN